MDKTKDLLQFKMESGLRTGKWDESKGDDLKNKAYDSHSDAYLEAGLADLPQKDIDKILTAVDRDDFFTLNAFGEALETAWEVPNKKKAGSIPAVLRWIMTGPSVTDDR